MTFYGLLALFPATAALVSLYGLFTDASSISEQLRMASGFLPEGGLEVDRGSGKTHRVPCRERSVWRSWARWRILFSLWGANAGTKATFDALNIIYKEREKRSFMRLTVRSLIFTLGAISLMLLALAGIVVVPVALKLLGISGSTWTLDS